MNEHISVGRRKVLVAIRVILISEMSTYVMIRDQLDILLVTIFLIVLSIVALFLYKGSPFAKPIFIFISVLKPFVFFVVSAFMLIQHANYYKLSTEHIVLLMLDGLSIFMIFAIWRSKDMECFFSQQRIKYYKKKHAWPIKNKTFSSTDKKPDISATENSIVIAFAVIMMLPVIIILFFVLQAVVFVLTGDNLGGLGPRIPR